MFQNHRIALIVWKSFDFDPHQRDLLVSLSDLARGGIDGPAEAILCKGRMRQFGRAQYDVYPASCSSSVLPHPEYCAAALVGAKPRTNVPRDGSISMHADGLRALCFEPYRWFDMASQVAGDQRSSLRHQHGSVLHQPFIEFSIGVQLATHTKTGNVVKAENFYQFRYLSRTLKRPLSLEALGRETSLSAIGNRHANQKFWPQCSHQPRERLFTGK